MHRAKGLEWPVVFVPPMTAKRFPSSHTGETEHWLVPRDRFNAARYEGSDGDERRLFYVAITRARDWLSVSRHERITSRGSAPARITTSSRISASSPRTFVRRRSKLPVVPMVIRSRSRTASWRRLSTVAWPSGSGT